MLARYVLIGAMFSALGIGLHFGLGDRDPRRVASVLPLPFNVSRLPLLLCPRLSRVVQLPNDQSSGVHCLAVAWQGTSVG